MTTIRGYVDSDQVGQKFQRNFAKYADRVRWAARSAAEDIAKEIEEKGRADISAAGHFGTRWTAGLQATVTEGGGNIKIDVTEAVPYWGVFEYGATIVAHNPSGLLWIPLTGAGVPPGVWPSQYPGRLFRVDRTSTSFRWKAAPRNKPGTGTKRVGFVIGDKAPLLFSYDTKKPLYFGKPAVTIPQKFHLRSIVKEEMARLPLLFRVHSQAIAKAGG